MIAWGVIEVTDNNYSELLHEVKSELGAHRLYIKNVGVKRHRLSAGSMRGPKGGNYGKKRRALSVGDIRDCCVKALVHLGELTEEEAKCLGKH